MNINNIPLFTIISRIFGISFHINSDTSTQIGIPWYDTKQSEFNHNNYNTLGVDSYFILVSGRIETVTETINSFLIIVSFPFSLFVLVLLELNYDYFFLCGYVCLLAPFLFIPSQFSLTCFVCIWSWFPFLNTIRLRSSAAYSYHKSSSLLLNQLTMVQLTLLYSYVLGFRLNYNDLISMNHVKHNLSVSSPTISSNKHSECFFSSTLLLDHFVVIVVHSSRPLL